MIRKKIPTFICVFFRKLFEFFSCFSFCMLFGKSVRIILMVCFGVFCNIFRTFFDKYSINMAEKLQRYFCVPKTKSNSQHKTMTSQSKPFIMKISSFQKEIWKEKLIFWNPVARSGQISSFRKGNVKGKLILSVPSHHPAGV